MSEKKESNLELCHLLPCPPSSPFSFSLANQLELYLILIFFGFSLLPLQLDPITTLSVAIKIFGWCSKKKKKKKKQAVMDPSLLPKPDQEVSKELKPETQASKRRCVGIYLKKNVLIILFPWLCVFRLFLNYLSDFIWHLIAFVCVLLQEGGSEKCCYSEDWSKCWETKEWRATFWFLVLEKIWAKTY